MLVEDQCARRGSRNTAQRASANDKYYDTRNRPRVRDEQVRLSPDNEDQLIVESLMPMYVFTKNAPRDRFDALGLHADVTWNPSLKECKPGHGMAFIQIGYGGSGPYKEPFVDDGSKGFGASGTGCPEYPNFGFPGAFEDSPKGLTGPVKFVVCLICTEKVCGCGADPKKNETGTRVVKIGPCKRWKKGDQGSLGRPPVQDALAEEKFLLLNTVTAKYPNWTKCYKCNHAPAR